MSKTRKNTPRALHYHSWVSLFALEIGSDGPEAAAVSAGVPLAYARRYREERRSAARRSARWDRETVRA